MIDYDEIIPQLGYFIKRHCTSSWAIDEAVIDFVDLTYIIEGSAHYSINGRTYEVEKGDLICIPKNNLRQSVSVPNNLMVSYAANFQVCNLEGVDASLPFPLVSKIGIRKELLSWYQELNAEWLHKEPGYKMRVRAIMLNILHFYFSIIYYKSTYVTLDPRIQKVTRYILDHFNSPTLVGDLARQVSLNPVYFGMLFKKNTGYSVKEYINRIRISNAENMLATGEFTVNEAAHRCGYTDVFYFSKIFKMFKGYSPSKVKIYKGV